MTQVDTTQTATSMATTAPGAKPQPRRGLLTEQEAIEYLGLENLPNPSRTLRYYREKGVLRGTKVGRRLCYLIIELDRFLQLQTGIGKRSG